MKHIITFEDDTIFEGDVLEGTWNKMPDKKIKKWEYRLNDKKAIIFENFEQYNHIIKFGKGFNNSMNGIITIYLLGKNEDKVYRIIFDFLNHKIIKDKVNWGEEYLGSPHPGWKLGLSTDKPSIKRI